MSLDMTRKGDLDRRPAVGSIRHMVVYRNKDKHRLEAEQHLPRRLRTPKEESRAKWEKRMDRFFAQYGDVCRRLANWC